jgi:RNA polymerase sigma factor (sigma-70 family)
VHLDRDERERRWAAVTAHRERLLRLSRARCANRQDAEDCVQEAMLRCVEFENLDEERLGAFLTTVTLRLCADLHRGRTRGDRLSRRLAAYSSVEPGPEDAVCDRAESIWLSRHVDTLPVRQREIVHARAAGQSCGAVAEQLRMSYAAIESALSRARRTLRVTLESTLGLAPWARYAEAFSVGVAVVAVGLAPGAPAVRHPAGRPVTLVPRAGVAVVAVPGRVATPARRAAAPLAAGPRAALPATTRYLLASTAGETPGSLAARAGQGGVAVGVTNDAPPQGHRDATLADCVWYGVDVAPRTGCRRPPGDPRSHEEQTGTQGIPRGPRP